MTSISAAVPDVLSLLEQINTPPGTWGAAINLASRLPLLVNKERQKQFAFFWQGQQYTAPVLLQGWINSPGPCCHVVFRELDQISLSQDIVLINYVVDIMLIGLSWQEVARSGSEGRKYIWQKLRDAVVWGLLRYPLQCEGEQVASGLSYNWDRGKMPSGPLWLLKVTYSSFRCATLANYHITYNIIHYRITEDVSTLYHSIYLNIINCTS